MPDLQPQQYADLYQEEELPLGDLRPRALRRLGYGGLVGLGLLLAGAATLPIPLQQNVDFELRGTQPEETYRFPQPVYVQRRLVQAGQQVATGAPLLVISSPQITELSTAYRQARWQRQQFEQHDTLLYLAQRRSLQLELARQRLSSTQLRQELALKQRQQQLRLSQLAFAAQTARQRLLANQPLEGRYLARAELRGLEQEARRTATELATDRTGFQRELASLRHSLTRLALDQRQSQQQLERLALERRLRGLALQQSEQLAGQRLRLNYGPFAVSDSGLVLKAPQAGQVSFVFDANKEVPAGTILVKLLARPTRLYALASVPPSRIAYLHPGQAAVLKVATFPHYEWGVVNGRLQTVSLTPDAAGNYPFTVALRGSGQLEKLLQIGMTGTLSVVVEQPTLLGLLRRRVQGWRDQLDS